MLKRIIIGLAVAVAAIGAAPAHASTPRKAIAARHVSCIEKILTIRKVGQEAGLFVGDTEIHPQGPVKNPVTWGRQLAAAGLPWLARLADGIYDIPTDYRFSVGLTARAAQIERYCPVPVE